MKNVRINLETHKVKERKQDNLIITTSWDDNSPINLKLAKLLNEYGINATFYICSEHDNFGNTFEKSGALKIQAMGFEIGSHSATHPDLTKTSDLAYEVLTSKRKLEARLNYTIKCFCYPYDLFDERVKGMVKSAGYKFARTANHTDLSLPEDPYECPVTLHASNHSPLQATKLIISSAISPLGILDWKRRAISIFKKGLKRGGIWHLYGHSWEIQKYKYWKRLEEVLKHISGRKDVRYLNNFDAWSTALSEE